MYAGLDAIYVRRLLPVLLAACGDFPHLVLAEQWQHFLNVQEEWHEGQTGIAPQLEEAALRLEEVKARE